MKSAMFFAFLFCFSNICKADSFTANFTGNLVHGACDISPKSLEQTVDFGSIIIKSLYSDGESPKSDLNIELIDCDLKTAQSATVTFSGISDTDQPNYLAVTGDAKGVAVGIEVADDGMLVRINNPSPSFDLVQGDMTLKFKTFVKASPAAIKNQTIAVGNFSSTATFVINYE
ncbi:fimbrial protein [Scandinavium goeteborgense]|uniref:fimbrial protein n=1 Tax=Scandinavium goeteborgense TaxID=1851514 RepID=UPI003828E03A